MQTVTHNVFSMLVIVIDSRRWRKQSMTVEEINSSCLTQQTSAIVATVAYADIFDYPLTVEEIFRYLIGVKYTRTQLQLALDELTPSHLTLHENYYTLPARQQIVATRKKREKHAQDLWPQAMKYGCYLAQLPFVKMVAVTGSLAVNNPVPNADIDYFIVTTNQRLWLCRALTIVLVKIAQRRGIILCPNYFVAENALALQNHSLYSAREMAQMVPIFGFSVYKTLIAKNSWLANYLPNATAYQPQELLAITRTEQPPSTGVLKTVSEKLLQTRVGTWLEQWEQRRKIAKFSAESTTSETAFNANWCKGHFDAHGAQILNQFKGKIAHIDGDK